MQHGHPARAKGRHDVRRVRLGVILVAFYGISEAQVPNQLTDAEAAAGWKLLWDGTEAGKSRDLVSGATGSVNTWVIDDGGLLDPNAPDAYLFTRDKYASFEFSVEWKTSPGGNSGIFPRHDARSGRCHAYEYAILDDFSTHPDADDVMKHPGETTAWAKRTGTAYDLYPTTEDGVLMGAGGKQVSLTRPAGQWNHGVIVANGNFVEHWLNGRKVVDMEIGSAEWNARFARSKYPGDFGCVVETYAKSASGHLAFQDHGADLRVWYRNLKIRPFVPGGKLPKPAILPIGPSGVVRIHSAVTGATVRYTLDGSAPTEASPEFKDSLVVAKAATLKAASFKPRFAPSEAAQAEWAPVSVAAAPGAGNRIGLERSGRRLRVANPDRETFELTLLAPDGSRAAGRRVDRKDSELALNGLKAGIYLARMNAGTWTRSRLLLIP